MSYSVDEALEDGEKYHLFLVALKALSQNRRPFQKPGFVFLKSAWGTWHTSAQ